MPHFTNTRNPIDFPKTIQVPTEDGIGWADPCWSWLGYL